MIKNCYHLNYSISKEYRGKGYGKKIIEIGCIFLVKKSEKIKKIKALVKKENIASQKIFNSLGFQELVLENVLVYIKTINSSL